MSGELLSGAPSHVAQSWLGNVESVYGAAAVSACRSPTVAVALGVAWVAELDVQWELRSNVVLVSPDS